MEYFTGQVRGVWVCVWYEACSDEQVVWIANVVTGDHVVSLDGLVALGTESVAKQITRSVERALLWATIPESGIRVPHSRACSLEAGTGANDQAGLSIPDISMVVV